MSLAKRLTAAMARAKLTQAELARACGVKPPSVHGWLSGKAKFLRGENLLSAARALGVRQQWLATGDGPMVSKDGDAANTEPGPDLRGKVPLITKRISTLPGYGLTCNRSLQEHERSARNPHRRSRTQEAATLDAQA